MKLKVNIVDEKRPIIVMTLVHTSCISVWKMGSGMLPRAQIC